MSIVVNFVISFSVFLTVYTQNEIKNNSIRTISNDITYPTAPTRTQLINSTVRRSIPKSNAEPIENYESELYYEVMKNITRVNSILENLIKNYEKLKKIYKSEELTEDYSKDDEIDPGFKMRHNRNGESDNKESKTTEGLVATAIFYSEENNDADDDFSGDASGENSSKTNSSDKNQSYKNKLPTSKKIETHSDITDDSLMVTEKTIPKTSKKTEHKINTSLVKKSSVKEGTKKIRQKTKGIQKHLDKNKAKMYKDQYHKDGKGNSEVDSDIDDDDLGQSEETSAEEDKHSRQKHNSAKQRKQPAQDRHESLENRSQRNIPKSKKSKHMKGVQTKHFTTNPTKQSFVKKHREFDDHKKTTNKHIIQKDSDDNSAIVKPKRSKHMQKDLHVDKLNSPPKIPKQIPRDSDDGSHNLQKKKSKHKKNKLADIPQLQQKVSKHKKNVTKDNDGKEYDVSNSEAIERDLSGVNDDIKKRKHSYKLAKKVLTVSNGKPGSKSVTKTKSSEESVEDEKHIIKEQFKTRLLRKAYGEACIRVVVKKCYKACKQALKHTSLMYKCKKNLKDEFKKASKRSCILEFGGEVTRRYLLDSETLRSRDRGYLGAVCLPPPKETKPRLRANETSVSTLGVKLNILRDKYERACQRESINKCTNACSDATVIACNATQQCIPKAVTKFKKECKSACKWSYKIGKGGKSKKGSDSDSSDSNSDSDTSDRKDTKTSSGSSDTDSSISSDTDVSTISNKTKKNDENNIKKDYNKHKTNTIINIHGTSNQTLHNTSNIMYLLHNTTKKNNTVHVFQMNDKTLRVPKKEEKKEKERTEGKEIEENYNKTLSSDTLVEDKIVEKKENKRTEKKENEKKNLNSATLAEHKNVENNEKVKSEEKEHVKKKNKKKRRKKKEREEARVSRRKK